MKCWLCEKIKNETCLCEFMEVESNNENNSYNKKFDFEEKSYNNIWLYNQNY